MYKKQYMHVPQAEHTFCKLNMFGRKIRFAIFYVSNIKNFQDILIK